MSRSDLKKNSMKKKVLRSYKKMPQAKLLSFANAISTRMSENELFVAFKIEVDDLKASSSAFSTALVNAADGGRQFTIIKDRCMDVVLTNLDDLADSVDKLAKGDEVIINASGFEVTKTPDSIEALSTPKNFEVLNAPRTGEIKASWKPQAGVTNYGIEYRLKDETNWKNGTYTSRSQVILKDFEMGSYVFVRIYAIGRAGLKSDYTEPAMVLVL